MSATQINIQNLKSKMEKDTNDLSFVSFSFTGFNLNGYLPEMSISPNIRQPEARLASHVTDQTVGLERASTLE